MTGVSGEEARQAARLLTEHLDAGCTRCDSYVRAVSKGMDPETANHLRCERGRGLAMMIRTLWEPEP